MVKAKWADLTALKERASALKRRLVSCDLCPHACGVNRIKKEMGFCRTTDEIVIAHSGLHVGEEPPISGTAGSGTIFFVNCNLRCVYCQNFQISQCAQEIPTRTLSPHELADEMLALQQSGAHNINLVSPTHVVAQVAESLCLAREGGLSLPVVYNTNGYDAVETLRCLEGLVDIYLPDIKYSDDAVAKSYSGIGHYVEVNRAAIVEMFRQVGNLTCDGQGIAQKGVLVRHLVLPGDLAGSEESLAFLASLSPKMYVSLMAQYTPQYKAKCLPPLDRRISRTEYETVLDQAWALGLDRCFIQKLEGSEGLVPDFRQVNPFGDKGAACGKNSWA
jgi:putative pyruvate formate lyase activating enzyme